MSAGRLVEGMREVATGFAEERPTRQQRRTLDPADFKRIAEKGFLHAGVPIERGGSWESVPRSARGICDSLRALAWGDSSVALVAAMHPTVHYAAGWLANPVATPTYRRAWEDQRRQVFQTALGGAWWGTITSEPGSGGDLNRTAAIARRNPDDSYYRLSGIKHFGTGSGVTSFMMTTAVADGESGPDVFLLDVRRQPWDGSTSMRLIASWDGHGMIATQSHAFQFAEFPATRVAWPLSERKLHTPEAQGFVESCFSAVVVGIVDVAVATARQQLGRRHSTPRAFEQSEWAKVEVEAWLIAQAYDGMLGAIETRAGRGVLNGKIAIADLAETILGRICRIIGGGTYGRASPFGHWFEDVRALGFLRPPWGLAFDSVLSESLASPGG
jgi:alkylation response protein AidB-like acyl-CoA dehydrogenase